MSEAREADAVPNAPTTVRRTPNRPDAGGAEEGAPEEGRPGEERPGETRREVSRPEVNRSEVSRSPGDRSEGSRSKEGRSEVHPSEGGRAQDRWARAAAWAELLRLPALFTVPGDALAGAAAVAARPDHRTLLAIGSSVCLYEAGMVLNDWADRAEDAVERPHRPLPSGRVSPAAAFTAACALTAAGLTLAGRAGRPALAVAAPLAATVWSYDLVLKHKPVGPLAMAAARGLDLLLGASATAGRTRPALPAAGLLATHTFAITTLSRQETRGGTPAPALAALATTAGLTWWLRRPPTAGPRVGGPRAGSPPGPLSPVRAAHLLRTLPGREGQRSALHPSVPLSEPLSEPLSAPLTAALAAAYAGTTARPYAHAALNPSAPLTQRAVGAGIRAMIPLQAALMARSGATAGAVLTAALAPVARRLARRVSVT